jgi:hydrogenase large subunit
MRGLNPLNGQLYLEALHITRHAREIASLMFGKYPHPSTIFPGGLGIEATAQVFNQVLGRIVHLLDYAKKVAAIWDDLVEFFRRGASLPAGGGAPYEPVLHGDVG